MVDPLWETADVEVENNHYPRRIIPSPIETFRTPDKEGWEYQEIPIPADLQSMTIRHNALRDIWREPVNRVNIERNKITETLIFQGNIEWLEVEIPRHSAHSE